MPNVPAAGAAFFAAVRPLFGGKLSQGQVDGIQADFDAWDTWGDGDDRKLAYILATDFHETGRTMQAVKETYNPKYDGDSQPDDAKVKRRLDDALRKKRIKRNYWKDGWFGRGKPQVTHKENYVKVSALVGIDFVSNPDLLLDLVTSSVVMVKAMLAGTFTGKKLGDFIGPLGANYDAARKVVNGVDHADEIADYAETFEAALRAARHAGNEAQADDVLRGVEEALKHPAEPVADPIQPAPEPAALPTAPEPETPVRRFQPNWWRIGIVAAIALVALIAIFH